MSLVVFPFKTEDPGVVGANLRTAASHRKVDEVWAVAAVGGQMMSSVSEIAAEISSAESKPVRVFAQDRIGVYRAGKGDGMNTAIRRAAEFGFERTHFYDADITNFDSSWIDGAETAADKGFGVVRHRFPRSSTDAMITWLVTRPGLAMTFPGTVLPRLGQPLGGELLLTAEAVEALAGDDAVTARSDWGIDTVLTYTTATLGLPLYEHNVASGKRHALYGSLGELKDMVVECLDAVARLAGRPAPRPDTPFDRAPPAPVPDDLKNVVAYDLDSTISLLGQGWTEHEAQLSTHLPGDLGEELRRNRAGPNFAFMDAESWATALDYLMQHFVLGDQGWENLAFRLWLTRVLAYSTGPALSEYDAAIDYLESTIRDYEITSRERSRPAPQV